MVKMSYINSYYVTYSKDIFYIELRCRGPKDENVVTKVYVNPFNAKGLMKALSKMITDYENNYGELPEPEIERLKEETKEMEDTDYRPGFIAN